MTIVILPFPRDILRVLPLFALRGAQSLLHFVRLVVMVRRCFMQVAGTIAVSVS